MGRRFATVGLALLAMVVVLAARPTAASAHAELLTSDPASAAILTTSPTQITLSFSEAVTADANAIRLFDGTGKQIEVGAVTHPGGAGAEVGVSVPSLAPGSYVVDWRVVSDDSHPVHAAFTFQVGDQSTLQPGLVGDVAAANHTTRVLGVALGVLRALVIAAMAVVIGGLVAIGGGWAGVPGRVRRLVSVGGLVGAAAGVLSLPVQTGYVTGRSWSVLTDAAAWRTTLETRVGTAWLIRAIVLVVAGVLTAERFDGRGRLWRVAVVAIAAALGVASAYGGHGATGRWHQLGIALTAVHVAAMSVWFGGLIALLIGLKGLTDASIRRFSAVALGAFVVIATTGGLQALRQFRSAGAVTHSSYGTALLIKLGIVFVLTLVATATRVYVHGEGLGFFRVPAAEVPAEVPVAPVRTWVDRAPGEVEPAETAAVAVAEIDALAEVIERRPLWRSLVVETVLGLAILGATSVLMASNPTRATAAPVSETLASGDYSVDVFVTPTRVGRNEIHLGFFLTGAEAVPDALTVTLADPAKDVAGIEVPLEPAGGSHFIASDVDVPYAGTWRIAIVARYGFNEFTYSLDVPVA